MNWGALWSFPFFVSFAGRDGLLVLKNGWSLYLKYLLVGSVNLKILNIMKLLLKPSNISLEGSLWKQQSNLANTLDH